MNKISFIIIGTGLILLLATCDIENVVVLAVKNKTHYAITGAYLLDDSVSDDEIYNDRVYMGINLQQDSLRWISMPDFKFGDKSDTSELNIFIFCEDSLKKYRRLGIKQGIISRSLIKKIILQSNTIKQGDTVIIK